MIGNATLGIGLQLTGMSLWVYIAVTDCFFRFTSRTETDKETFWTYSHNIIIHLKLVDAHNRSRFIQIIIK